MDDNTNPFDRDPPLRPSLELLGGDGLKDEDEFPPDAATMVTAATMVILRRLVASYGATVPCARISVAFVTGAPVIQRVDALRAAAHGHPELFTVTLPATGHVRIAWPAETFPPDGPDPSAYLRSNVAAMAPFCVHGTNRIDVFMRDGTGADANLGFIVDLFRDST